MPQRIVISTIGDCIDQAHGLHAHCENVKCLHWAPLDLPALAIRFGRDFDTDDLRPRLRCARCGGRICGLQVRAPVPDVHYPRHDAVPEIATPRSNVQPVRQPSALAMRRYRIRAMETASP